jgi:ABC-type Fe3+-hydroxamate transport system substrate-binding protein
MNSMFLRSVLTVLVSVCIGGSACAGDGYPRRIVSLGPSVTEELYLLGAGDRVVGVTNYCLKPPQARGKERVGTVKKANLEKIIGLNPDLVIATSLTDLKETAKLRDVGIRVITMPLPKDYSQICANFLELGAIVGKRAESEDIVIKARDRIRAIQDKCRNSPKVAVFVQIGAKPLVTANRDSFLNGLIELSGGVNIAAGSAGLSYMPYSREKVLEADPDVIIIVTMGIAGKAEKEAWETFKNLKAVRDKRIYIVDSDKFCSLTPLTFVEALKDISGILRPGTEVE